MPPTQIALVRYQVDVPDEEFFTVAAALQTQATRDVASAWGVEAIISPFLDLEHVPPGYFPLLLVEAVEGGHGYHVPGQGLPMAAVQYQPGWSVLASHEMIEMLVDPWGNFMSSAWTPEDGWRQYIVEVCDPCQDVFYLIDDIPVSDFVTPDYFDPSTTRDVRYSFTGALRAPLTLTAGGAVSYAMPSGAIRQSVGTGGVSDIDDGRPATPLRASTGKHSAANPLDLARIGAVGTRAAHRSRQAYAATLRRQVAAFVRQSRPRGGRRPAVQVSRVPASALPSQRERINALLEQLGNPAYTTHSEFKKDPEAVLRSFGIDLPDDKATLKRFERELAPQSHFAQVVRSHRTGSLLGSPDDMDYTKTHAGYFG